MSLHRIDGHLVYVVEFSEMPRLPIVAGNETERPYAEALHRAIERGIIIKPGKYAIELGFNSQYQIHEVIENADPTATT